MARSTICRLWKTFKGRPTLVLPAGLGSHAVRARLPTCLSRSFSPLHTQGRSRMQVFAGLLVQQEKMIQTCLPTGTPNIL